MNQVYDVIVVGGGVIGMTCALRLAQTGRSVLVIEKARCGDEASSAAAGMLGAQLEVAEPGDFYQLCLESRKLYQAFADELYEVTGIDAQLTHNGILQLAYTEDEVEALMGRLRWQTNHGEHAQWLTPTEVSEREAALAPSLGGLLLPDDGNIHAPLLMRALAAAVNQRCTVLEGTEVVQIDRDVQGNYAIITPSASFHTETVVVANGAFASRLLAHFGVSFTVQPVKGQLLAIRPRHGQSIRHTLFSRHSYLVPKRDGSVVVGATEDHASGFNYDVTSDAIMTLLQAAGRIAPGLDDAVFERSWVGLRPLASDERPWIGELPEFPNLHLAVGHFRNGILLAPVTGSMIVQSVEQQAWLDHWQSFRAQRAVSKKEVPAG